MLMILFSTLGMSKHIESELQDNIGWDRLQPADFNAGRTGLVGATRSYTQKLC